MRLRFTKWAIVCAMTVSTALVVAGGAIAQTAPEEILVDFSVKDADMIAATRMLTQQTGLMFVVEPSPEPFPRITLSLKGVSAEEVLRYMVQAAGATYRRDPNGVYIISRTRPEPIVVNRPADPAKPKAFRKIRLLRADARDVFDQIKYGRAYEGGRGFADIARFRDQIPGVQARQVGGAPIIAGNPATNNFTPTPVTQLFSNDSSTGIALPGEGQGQADMVGGGGGGRMGGGGFGGFGQPGGGGLGQPGAGGLGGGGFGGGGGQTLQPGQGLVGQSIDYVSYDPVDNSIVVRGSEEDIADLQRFIATFDVAPRQVIVKVEFVTTSTSITRSLGFDWLYERGTIFAGNRPGSFARAGDPVFLSYATGNVTARMRALLTEGRGRSIQSPVLRTLNNQPAVIQNLVNTWIFLNQLVSVGNGQVISAPQLVQVPVQTVLAITPRINEDGTVVTFINVTLSDFGQIRRSPEGQEVPDILQQTVSIVARVRSGESIALGGLTRKQDTGSESRIPVLGDLPIVGQFFRTRSREVNNQELIIFVTPTIVEDEDNAGLGP
ncbi:MAG: hypothetical protein SNJ76_00590 [Fimbriimonadaceae bacterium]